MVMKRLSEYLFFWTLGGTLYYSFEMIFRGFSHWSMFMLGGFCLIFPVFFQAIGYAVKSSVLTIVRTVLFFVPLGYIFSRFGLQYFWLTFPVTELLTSVIGVGFYRNFLKREQTI